MPSRRVERVNELLRVELGELLLHTLRDPRLAGLVSITEVRTTQDIRHSRVFISVLGTPEERRSTLIGLQAAAGFLRKELSSRLTLRYVPDLTFRADESIERGERIIDLLRHVNDPANSEVRPESDSHGATSADTSKPGTGIS